MKSYTYVARDASGLRKEGLKPAASTNDVIGWLHEQGCTPISVNEVSNTPKQSKAKKKRRRRIKSAELAAVCWQLTTMLEGGISVTVALETISEDIDNLRLRKVLKQISEKIHKGQSFSEGIKEFPKVFNSLSQAIILAGETGGNLAEALRRVAQYFDDRDRLARKVKKAMAYPAFVVFFIVAILIFIMAFIIPRFRIIFDQIGGKLPVFTQIFIGTYDLIVHNLHYIVGGGALLVILSSLAYNKTEKGHYFFSKTILRLPLLGKVCAHAFIVTFCRTMSTLVGAGVSVLDVFDVLSQMTNNDIIKSAIIKTREYVVEGSGISASMLRAGFFPNMVVKMVEVGEKSGSLTKVLDRTSDYYERKVDSAISTLMALLEPILIVTVGAIVLVIVLALYLPIFTMSDIAG